MNVERLRERAQRAYDAEMGMLDVAEKLPEGFPVRAVTNGLVHVEPMEYARMKSQVSALRRGGATLTLRHYFMCGDQLCVTYGLTKHVDLIFSLSDAEHALSKLSQGKCHLETSTTEEAHVVCGLGE